MTRSKLTQSRGHSHDRDGLIKVEEIFLHPGEQAAVDPGPPLTPDEQFRKRVAAAWAWVKAIRFQEHEHERLARVLVEMVAAEVNHARAAWQRWRAEGRLARREGRGEVPRHQSAGALGAR